jgi:hypothetical protein
MKKLLSLAVATFALAAMAEYTGQTIGVTKITTTNQNTIVAVPFASLTNSLADISANDLVSPVGLPTETVLQVFKSDKYYGWQLNNNGVWVAVGDQASTSEDVIANSTVACGGAIWVVLPKAPATSQDIYIYGDFSNPVEVSSLESGKNNLVANPLQSRAAISVVPTPGDVITVTKDGIADKYEYKQNKAKTSSAWRKDGAAASLPQIEVGQGIWYYRAGEKTNITWAAD